jgi:hypothetical protein
MNSDNNLFVTIDVFGVFVNFKASDGTEARMSIIEVAKDLGEGFGRTLAQWCEDRIKEQSPNTLSPNVRNELLVQIEPLIVAQSDFDYACEHFGDPQPINQEWLDQEEARAHGAAAVTLPGDQFLELLALARNGFRSEVAS